MQKVSVIIPTYNEAPGILIFLKRLERVFKKIDQDYQREILIIDDDSPDSTGKIVKKKRCSDKGVRVFIRKGVRGLGTAIGLGIEKARGEIIIGIDADGNHPAEAIPFLLENLKNYDLVVASRFIKGGGVEKKTDIIRHLVSFGVNFIFRILGSPVWDSTSGCYAIRKKDLLTLNPAKIYYGYGDYHLRLVYFAKQKNYRIGEVPYIYKRRIAGESKSRLAKMFFDYLAEAVRLRWRT